MACYARKICERARERLRESVRARERGSGLFGHGFARCLGTCALRALCLHPRASAHSAFAHLVRLATKYASSMV
eukprot:235971-Pleurochrysis_carterae.AAC.3